MATDRTNIGNKFQNTDIPSESDFKEIFDSFVHRDEDKADFQMVENGLDTEHYVTPALLNVGLKNIGIITGNCYMPHKENFENSFSGTILPLTYFPIPKSVKVFKNGQLLQEGPDYTVNYDTAQIKFLETVNDRNLEVDYWYKNLSPNPGSGSATAIDFTSFLHTSGNETKTGLLTFNNTTATSTSGVVLKNSGAEAGATSLDVTNSGSGSGISLQNSSTGTGVKVSNTGTGVAVNVNSAPESTGDILQVSKNNTVQTKIDSEGNVTAPKFVTSGGTRSKFVKGDGFLDPTVYAEDTKVIHTTGNESKDGALTLINSSPQDVLTIEKNDDANCLKLVQNSNSDATTSSWDTSTTNAGRKAISIQKQGEENAFITHDGDVTAHSFSTTKANLTDDGLFSLANRPSPESSEGKAKLYAKTDGTDTDMYVMGSDGVEKKIGGVVDLSGKENIIAPGTTAQYYRGDKSWQTLDKTVVGLANVDNTSDLNKPVSTATQTALNNILHKTGYATETKSGELVIDSGVNNISGLVLSKLPSVNTFSTVSYTSQSVMGGIVILPNGDSLATSSSNSIYKIPFGGGPASLYGTIPVSNSWGIALLPNGDALVISQTSTSVYKIPAGGGAGVVYGTGLSSNPQGIAILANGDALVTDYTASAVLKIPFGGGTALPYGTGLSNPLGIDILPNGDALVVNNLTNTISKIANGGGVAVVYATGLSNPKGIAVLSNGDTLVTNNGNSAVMKISSGGGVASIYSKPGFSYSGIDIFPNGEVLVMSHTSVLKLSQPTNKPLITDSLGKIIKTTYLEDVQYLKASDVDLSNLVTKNNIKTINGVSIVGSGDIVTTSSSAEPTQITITTAVSITTDTLDANSKKQLGKNIIINNGTSAISITVNGGTDFCASYLKHGTAAITFVQAAGRTLIQVNATAILNGAVGSTATISSIGTTDYLRISNI